MTLSKYSFTLVGFRHPLIDLPRRTLHCEAVAKRLMSGHGFLYSVRPLNNSQPVFYLNNVEHRLSLTKYILLTPVMSGPAGPV